MAAAAKLFSQAIQPKQLLQLDKVMHGVVLIIRNLQGYDKNSFV
jgi:hypothetical protein